MAKSYPFYSEIPGMDPLADWLLETPAVELYLPDPDNDLIPFFILFEDDDGANAFATLATGPTFNGNSGEIGEVLVPEPFTARDAGKDQALCAFALRSFFDNLRDPDSRQSDPATRAVFVALQGAAKRILLGRRNASLPAWKPGFAGPEPSVAPEPIVESVPSRVVMAVIDDGIAFAHHRFRLPPTATHPAGSTRVVDFLRMDAPPIELFKPAIDNLILTFPDDDEALYRAAGVVDFSTQNIRRNPAARRVSHGTHILDLAAGYDPSMAPDDRPIIAVQLPERATADPVSGGVAWFIWLAVRHVVRRAEELFGGDARIVINCSYGLFAGPHDGDSPLEKAMDALIASKNGRLRIVVPAGNGHVARCHAEFTRAQLGGAGTRLDLIVQPDDRTISLVEIWLPQGEAGLDVTIAPPDGAPPVSIDDSSPVSGAAIADASGTIVGMCVFSALFGSRAVFLIALLPTVRFDGSAGPLSPAGRWALTLAARPGSTLSRNVHAWVERDESPFDHPRRGGQSRFDHPADARFDLAGRREERDLAASPVRRLGMINSFATGREVMVAAALVARERRRPGFATARDLTFYTAGGTATAPTVPGPTVALVAEETRVLGGVIAAGAASGVRLALGGTSISSPQLARLIADVHRSTPLGPLPDKSAIQLLAVPLPAALPQRQGAGRISSPYGSSHASLPPLRVEWP